MAIINYKDDIHKDTHVFGYKTYIGNGIGCSTIWFKNVYTARKAKYKDGIKLGSDLVDCSKCRCSHSSFEKNYNTYPEYICKEAKEKYAKSFE